MAVYAGDTRLFMSCRPTWIGDAVCTDECDHGVLEWAASHGATHVRRIGGGSQRVGTDVSSTGASFGYSSFGSASARDVYANWHRFRLFVVSAEDRACLPDELQ